MKNILLVLFLCGSALLTAQTETSKLFNESPIFAQFGLGVFPHFSMFNGEFSAAAGYRFNRYIGLGVEYRSTGTHNESFGRGANVLGVQLRAQNRRGWLANLGVGRVIDAYQGSDNQHGSEYRDGGEYLSLDVGYQFRWGGTLGAYVTSVRGISHYNTTWSDDTNRNERTGTMSEDEFGSFGVKLGLAFPWRGKWR